MKLLGIGSEFDGGVVIGMNSEVVFVRKNERTETYSLTVVELLLLAQQQKTAAA